MAGLSIIAAGTLRYSSYLQFRPTFRNTGCEVSPCTVVNNTKFVNEWIILASDIRPRALIIIKQSPSFKNVLGISTFVTLRFHLGSIARLPLIESVSVVSCWWKAVPSNIFDAGEHTRSFSFREINFPIFFRGNFVVLHARKVLLRAFIKIFEQKMYTNWSDAFYFRVDVFN